MWAGVKWGGLVAAVVLLALGIASRYRGLGYSWLTGTGSGRVWRCIDFNSGQLKYRSHRSTLSNGLVLTKEGWQGLHPDRPDWRLTFSLEAVKAGDQRLGSSISVPIWLPLGVLVPLAAWVWVTDARTALRRRRIGCCPRCRYDLRGLPARAACPECGAVGSR